MTPAIEIDALTKDFGRTRAVDRLSLTIRQGEIFGLLGPNGAGKSTTLYMCTGLVRPTAGSVRILGHDVRSDFLRAVGPVGSLIEAPSFCSYLSARSNLNMLSRLAGPGVDADEAGRYVGLSDRLRDRVRAYSHGMKQRLGIAQALLGRPRILILDEPTSGLDPEGTRDLLELLKEMARDRGLTVVLSSHLLHEVEAVCDRVAVIRAGRLVACGEVKQLLAQSEDTVLAQVDDAARAAELLRDARFVVEVKATSEHNLEARLEADASARLNEWLVQRGVCVSELATKRPTLQEFFFRVAARDAPAPVTQDAPAERSDAAARSLRAPASEDSSPPGLLGRMSALVRNELTKALGQKLPYIIAAMVAGVAVVHFFGKRLAEGVPEGNGFAFVLLSTQMSLSMLGAIFLVAYASLMVAGETSTGTARLFLTRPVRRLEYYASKALLALAVEAGVIAVAVLAAFAVGALSMNFGDLMDDDVVIYTRGALLWNLFLGCAACVVTLYAPMCFGLMISAWTRSVGTAVASAIGLYLFLDVSKHFLGIGQYVFTTYIDAPLVSLADMMDGLDFAWGGDVWMAMGVCAASSAAFLLVGALGLCWRDLND